MVSSAGSRSLVFALVVLVALLGAVHGVGAHDFSHGRGRDIIRLTATDSPDPVRFIGGAVSTMTVDAYVRKVRGLGAAFLEDIADCDFDRWRSDHDREWFVRVFYTIRQSNGALVNSFEREVKLQPPFDIVQLPDSGGRRGRFVRVPPIRIAWNGKRTNGSLAPAGTYKTEVYATFIRSHEHRRGRERDRIIDISETVKGTITVQPPVNPLVLNVTAPTDGAIVATTAVTATGSVAGGQSPLSLRINNQSVPLAANGTFSRSVALIEGSNALTFVASDAAGQSVTRTVTVVRDMVRPVVSVTPANGATVTVDRPTLTVSYSDMPGSGIQVASFSARLDNVNVTAGFNAGATGGSFTPTTPLSNGSHSLEVSVSDRAGNQTVVTSSFVVSVSTAAPTIAIVQPANDAITAQSSILVTGPVTGSGTLTVTVNGVAATLSSGTFSATVPLTAGSNAISAVVQDSQSRTAQATVTVLRDSTAPTLAVTPANGATLTVDRPTLTATYSDSSGSGINVASFSARLDDLDVTAGFNAGPTGGSFTPATPLANGSHALVVAVRDRAGNQTTVTSSFIVIVTAAPTIAIAQPANDAITAQASILVTGTVTGSGALSVTVNGVAATLSSGTFSATVPLSAGSNTVTAIVQDSQSRQAQAAISVVRDSVAPTVEIARPAPASQGRDARPVLEVSYADASPSSGLDLDSFEATLDATNIASSFTKAATGATFTPATNLADGPHTLVSAIRDRAGNRTQASSTFTIDTVAPLLTLAPSNGSFTASGTPSLIATYADPDPGTGLDLASFRAFVDGVDRTSSFTVGAVQASFAIPPAGRLSAGAHTFRSVIADRVGNVTDQTVTFVVDDVAPTVSITAPQDGSEVAAATPEIRFDFADNAAGSGIAAAAVRLTLDGADVSGQLQVGAGSAQLTPPVLSDGEHQAVASVTDRVGNTASATSRFTVRTAPPVPTGAGFAVGDVLDATNGTPMSGATVKLVGGASTAQTNGTGKFALPLLAGEYRIEIEKAGYIGPVERRVTILTGRDSVVEPIVLYPLDSVVTSINSSTGGTASNADGSIQVTFAAGSLGANADVRITATPDLRSMPEIPSETIVHETALDIKPEGMVISSPATISIANSRNLSAGHRMAVYAFNHTTGLFEVVGSAIVLPDGTRIVGQTTHFSRLYFACNETRPQAGAGKAPPEQRASNRAPRKGPEPQHPGKPEGPCDPGVECNSPGVLTKTGELVESFNLPAVWTLNSPAALSFTYRSHAAKPQSVVRVSFNHRAVPALPQEQQVTVAVGTQVTQARYAPTNDRISQHNVLWNGAGADGQKVKSGSYPWTAKLTALFDGVDPNTGQPNRIPFGLASDEHGYVLVQNLEKSIFGAGWNLGSLAEIHANPDGTALLVENGGGLTHFLRGWNVRTFAGSLTVEDFQGDGGPLDAARFSDPGGMVSLADGTVLVADTGNRRIRSVSPAGTIQTIYGTGEAGFSGDGGPAAQARFNRPTQMARDDVGNVYVLDALDNGQQVVRRINAAGIVTSIAGAGVTGHHVSSFATTPAGDVYFSDFFTGKVFLRTAAGVISVLDNGILGQGSVGDGNTVTRASINYCRSVAYDPEIGALYVQEFDRIRRVDAAGIIRLFAGAGTRDSENTAAIGVRLLSFDLNASIAVGRDGSVYVLQGQFGDILRRITRGGTIERAVGTTTASVYNGSGQLEGADTTYVNVLGNRALGLGFAPDGNLLVGVGGAAAGSYIVSVGHTVDGVSWYRAQAGETTILRGSASGFTTLSTGLLVRTFDLDGRMTTSTDSNGQAWTYEWAQDGTLTRITDPVQRNYALAYQSGKLASITDPAGRTTQFTVDGSGDLAEVVMPDGARWKYTYDTHLLRTTEDPRGGITRITYGADNMVRGIDEPDLAHVGYVPEDSLHLIVPPATLPLTPPTLAMATPDDFESTVTLPSGNTRKSRTTKNGIVTQQTDELGRVTSAALDDRDLPTSYTRADGSTIVATFDARSNPQFTREDIPASTPVVQPRGPDRLETRYTFDPQFDKPTEIVVGRARITMGYDTRGNLTRATNAVNASTLATYDSRGLLTELTNPRGFKTRFSYDAAGNLSTLADATGAVVRLTRDGAGNVTRIENRRGFPTTMTYDAAGRVTTITDALQGTVTLGRNSSGEVTSIRDQRGNTTSLGYDIRGRLNSTTDALNRTSTWTHDGEGNVRTFTNAKQRTTEYTYDAKRRLILERSPSGSERRLEYDINGHISKTIDPENRSRTLIWGSMGQLLGLRDGNNAVLAEYFYENGNRLVRVLDAIGGFTDVLYDDAVRVSAISHGSVVPPPGGADNLQLTFLYDENNNIVREFRFVNEIRRQFDSLDRVVGTTSSFPAESNFFTYDAEGNLTSFRNGNNATWRFAYDALNRLEREEDPETPANVTLLEYDAASNLTRRTDALGRVTSIDYDPLNRWIRRTFATGQETAAYDETGQLTRVEGNGASIDQTFDIEDRLRTQIVSAVGLNRSLLFDYDRSHRRTALAVNGIATNTYQWDTNGRLASLTGPSGLRTDFQYDLLGNITRKSLPNNVQLDQTYDGRGRVLRQLYTHPLGGTLEDIRYSRNRTDVIVNDSLRGQTSYAYDFGFMAQLNHVQHPDGWREEFTYDRANNRTRRVTVRGPEFHVQDFTYSPGNRLLTQTNDGRLTTYGYDNVGNLTSIASSAGTTSLTWDGKDQLVQIRYPDGGISSTSYLPASPLRYEQQDPDGRTTRFLFDPGTGNVLQELDASGATSAQFLHGLGLDETLARVQSSQTLTFITDHLETTRNLVDAAGNVANTYDYWAFGEVRQAQETVANAVRFTGRELDRFSGLQYTRNRWYSAELGRFISRDPIGFRGGLNLYDYTGNNPATYSDPSGLLITIADGADREFFLSLLRQLAPGAKIDTDDDLNVTVDTRGVPGSLGACLLQEYAQDKRRIFRLYRARSGNDWDANARAALYANLTPDPSQKIKESDGGQFSYDIAANERRSKENPGGAPYVTGFVVLGDYQKAQIKADKYFLRNKLAHEFLGHGREWYDSMEAPTGDAATAFRMKHGRDWFEVTADDLANQVLTGLKGHGIKR